MKKFLPFIISGVVVLLVILLPVFIGGITSGVYLPERDYGYEITAYDVDIVVNDDGSYDINETIDVHFTSSDSHGIYRWLPVIQSSSYNKDGKVVEKNFRSKITDVEYHTSQSSENTYLVDEYESGGYYFLQMGSSYYVPYGSNLTYSFSYNYDFGDDRETDLDMLYYNIIGTGWDTTISNLTFSITFPKAVSDEFEFYVGRIGESSTNSEQVEYSFDGLTLVGRYNGTLDYGEAVTVFKTLEEGYFNYDKSYVFDIVLLVLTGLFVGCAVLVFLKKRRKSPIIEVVEFKAPEGISPTEAGLINDGKVTGDDLSALLVYWASKGIVKIKNDGKKTVILRVATDEQVQNGLKPHEKILFNDLFRGGKTEVEAFDLGLSVDTGYKCKTSVTKETKKYFDNGAEGWFSFLTFFAVVLLAAFVFKSYYQSVLRGLDVLLQILMAILIVVGVSLIPNLMKYKDKCSKKKFWLLLVLDLILIFAPLVVFMFVMEGCIDSFGARFYLLLVPSLLVIFYPNLERYTEAGRKILGQIRGLKNYIEVAEKDRMEMLVKDNPSLFFEVLPYAYVLGVSDVYMKKFEDVQIVQPEWYQSSAGDWTTFILINHFMNPISVSMRANFTRHLISSVGKTVVSTGKTLGGGGFGGHSGGGHGGGGGGRW